MRPRARELGRFGTGREPGPSRTSRRWGWVPGLACMRSPARSYEMQWATRAATSYRRPLMEVVIVGAGTFGASLAWWLARSGEHVTLVDQYEPGDARPSSGGETRLFRCAHGPDAEYTAMARRARTLWQQLEDESGEELLVECGMAWFAKREDGWEAASERVFAAQGIPCERLAVAEASELYPSFRSDDLAFSCSSRKQGCCVRSVRYERWQRRRSLTARGSYAGVRDRMAQRSSSRTRHGSTPMSSSGRAGRGSQNSSRTSSRSGSLARSCSFLTAGRAGVDPAFQRGATTTFPGTALRMSMGSASKLRPTRKGPRSTPMPTYPRRRERKPTYARTCLSVFRRLPMLAWSAHAHADTRSRRTRASSQLRTLPTPACGSLEVDPAMVSSTARQWQSASPLRSDPVPHSLLDSPSARERVPKVCARRARAVPPKTNRRLTRTRGRPVGERSVA